MIARIRATTSKILMSPPKKLPTSPNTHKTKRIIITTQTQFGILNLLLFIGTYRCILPVEVRDKSHYADDDEINTNQIIEYLGENHNNDAENDACYPHPQT